MVYWVLGLCLLSGILKTREYNVSETGSVSETLCSNSFLESRMMDIKTKSPVILSDL
jgi:hypothetical protein